jgi:DNA-binding CsgD family transcriptional regulator
MELKSAVSQPLCYKIVVMKLDPSYSIIEHLGRTMKLMDQRIGEGVYPTNQELSELWESLINPMPPRTYMYILQTKGNRSFRSKGFSIIGLPDSWSFSADQVLGITHVNQRKLVIFQTMVLYETFLTHAELIRDKGVVYCTSRGVKNYNEEDSYYLVHQTAYPVQYDANGYVTKYFCSYRVLGDYEGQALETQVFTDPKYPEVQKKLREVLQMAKSNMLGILDFSETEQDIINYLAHSDLASTKEIAEHMERSVKTIANHRNSINRKARTAFPLNNFQNTEDVIKYLQQQMII